jgi:hypothetical protein
VLSKVFEKLIHKRISTYLENKGLLSDNQYGFRGKRSTKLALAKLVPDIQNALADGQYCVAIFWDLKKAFDTVDHNILLKKMEHLGIRGNILELIKNYLANRVQATQIGQITSSFLNITCGVPQGSILGPLLFLIYVNDLSRQIKNGSIKQFADDATTYYVGRSPQQLEQMIQPDVNRILTWFRVNRLTLNAKKTELVCFRSQKKTYIEVNIMINLEPITQTKEAKYLGLILDENLSWNGHTQRIRKRTAQLTGAIWRIRNCIPKNLLVTMYNSLILPHLTYGIELWGTAFNSVLLPLELIQKRAIRCCTNSRYRDHTEPLFQSLKALKVRQLYVLKTAQLVYQDLNGANTLGFVNETVRRTTRSSSNTKVKLPNTQNRNLYCKQNLMFAGARLYNELPQDIKDALSLSELNRKITLFLLNNTFDVSGILFMKHL